MANMAPMNGVGDWQPSTPDGTRDNYMKLLGTVAHDNPDALNGTNKLVNFVGKAMGKPNDNELGQKGRNF